MTYSFVDFVDIYTDLCLLFLLVLILILLLAFAPLPPLSSVRVPGWYKNAATNALLIVFLHSDEAMS